MQTENVNVPIVITGRHVEVTQPLREHIERKIEALHLDYPKIIEVKVILDVQHKRHFAEIVLFCANHITIEADTETEDMYHSIDDTVTKIARRMRKFKTRLLKSHRPRSKSIRFLEEHVFTPESLESEVEEIEPVIIHQENYKVRPLYQDEAIVEMELSERNFIVFHNEKLDKLSVIFRRPDGDYGMIVPEQS